MGNCNSAKKRDLQKAKALQAQKSSVNQNAQKSSAHPTSAVNTLNNHGGVLDRGVDAAGNQISSSYTDRKLKEKEMFKNIIERTQQKLIDVSQSPGGILDWSEEPEQENQTENISKLRQVPHTQLCKQLFDLTNIRNSTIEELANMELIRPEEIDLMVSAMRLQENKMNSMALENVGELVIRLEVEE
mmetsp:Transcript_7717/g.28917  ORF Transcript_7717/g.28917 Transcript_7717/m.28917 type:complete len:187 (+) Transcript_7717:190-750(+)